jgi:cyclopropane fatty-acyl-phospholipid synthase-like methyltransferase
MSPYERVGEVNNSAWDRYVIPKFPCPVPELLEGESSIYSLSTFAAAMDTRFSEGIKLLDYGCGSGRFGAFMCCHLKDFKYWGTDTPGQLESFPIRRQLEQYNHKFISLTDVDGILNEVTDILLLSVLTHLPYTLHAFLKRVKPVLLNGGMVHASLFVDGKPDLILPKLFGSDGIPIYYRQVIYTRSMIDHICATEELKTTKVGSWTKDGIKQLIYRFWKE